MSGRRLLVALGVAFFLVLLVRTAWLGDDAYLTLRTADNAARGLGFGWNPMDRVQVYDHPLWMLLLTAGRLLTGEVYFSSLGLSIGLSVAAVAMVLSAAATDAGLVLAVIALALSPSFLTWSTSGLEGPLVHALLAALVLVALDDRDLVPRGRRIACLAGLAALAHPFTVALTLPVAWRVVGQQPRGRRGSLALALLPVVAWIVLATWYYGSPFPMPLVSRWHADAAVPAPVQGLGWLLDAIRRDPLALAAIGGGVVAGRVPGTVQRRLAIGLLLYVALVVLSGASLMSGRYLGAPLVVSTILVARQVSFEGARVAGPVLVGAAALATLGPATQWSDVGYRIPHDPGDQAYFERFYSRHAEAADKRIDPLPPNVPRPAHPYYDARALDYPATGLLRDTRQSYPPVWDGNRRAASLWREPVRVALADDRPGFTGFVAGHGVYILSSACDPLIAHIRARSSNVTPDVPNPYSPYPAAWQAHQHRARPAGYVASLPWAANRIADPGVHAFYDRVRLVTRGSLGDWRRLPTGLWLAVGGYDYLLASWNSAAHDRPPEDGLE